MEPSSQVRGLGAGWGKSDDAGDSGRLDLAVDNDRHVLLLDDGLIRRKNREVCQVGGYAVQY
jgi:hypothetical protein